MWKVMRLRDMCRWFFPLPFKYSSVCIKRSLIKNDGFEERRCFCRFSRRATGLFQSQTMSFDMTSLLSETIQVSSRGRYYECISDG